MLSFVALFWVSIATAQDANDNGCVDAYEGNGACVAVDASFDPSSTVGALSDVRAGAVVGPQTAIGADVVIAERATLGGRVAHPSNPVQVGDMVVVGRRSVIGVDHVLGQGTVLGRAVTAGANLTTGSDVFIGYGSTLGSDVTIASNATVGSLVDVGDHTSIGGSAVLARGVSVSDALSNPEGSVINGIVGPESSLGVGVLIESGARLRKGVVVQDGATVGSTGRVGRGVTLGEGSTVLGSVRAGAQVGDGAVVGDGAIIPRGGEVCPSAVVPDDFTAGAVYPAEGCINTSSCLAILNSGGSTGSGLYSIDPDGPGGQSPQSVYCDMSTDGGGWTLVARIASGTSAHRNDAAVGTLTSPTQPATAKLSDLDINTLRGPDLNQNVLRLSCGSVTTYFQEDLPFSATLLGSSAIDRCAPTWDATTWYQASPYFSHGGVNSWQRTAECGYVIYTIGDNGYLGCWSHVEGHNQNGTLWVK